MRSKIHLSLAGLASEASHHFIAPSLRQMQYLEARLGFLSQHFRWHGLSLSPREWGELLVASWRKEYPVPGVTGGIAFIGGNYRSLTSDQCSEVITIAEELIEGFGVRMDSPPEFPIGLRQVGDCLSDLARYDALSSLRPSPHAATMLRAPSPWGRVGRRPRLLNTFEDENCLPIEHGNDGDEA